MASAPLAGTRPRRRYIDWARGLAVLIMIEAHTLDAWTRVSSRSTGAYYRLSMLGGFAAPLFLWLAGLSLVLAAERALCRSGRRAATEAIVRRGAEIFILAFLFRVQAFVVSPGSWPVTLFRVDILNVMGPAIILAGLLWGVSGSAATAAVASGSGAIAIAMVTPLVQAAGWVDSLPLWIQWYVRPFGDQTTFTLFPWSGFVFAGVCVGILLARAETRQRERRLLWWLSLAGIAFLGLGFFSASLPSIYHASSFWTTSPTYFAIRIGAMLLALGGAYAITEARAERVLSLESVEKFGRNSLFIYWIHVEIVYGYATWMMHQRLPLWGTATAFALFTAALYWAIALKDRVVERWRPRGAATSTPPAVPA